MQQLPVPDMTNPRTKDNSADMNAKYQISVLLVDDEDQFRQTVARRLERRGMQVGQAADGQACMAQLSTGRVDVVVLDVRMPGISGIETLKAIRQTHKDIQVIFLTGNAAVPDGVAGIKAGAFDYLAKPVDMDHLANKIYQAREMTRLEQAEKREAGLRAKLEKKMIDAERLMSLGTISTGIAHEINNPLAVINEAAGFMRQVVQSPALAGLDEARSLGLGLDKIEASIGRAKKITHQLLGYVKKQASGLARVDIRLLLEDSLDLIHNGIEDKKARVVWQISPDHRFLYSDPYQIRQVLINLLNNALDALPENGRITLSTFGSGPDLCFVIQDNGCGIPQKDINKIFDPFFTTKSFDQGTGLGLYVVHRILGNLGGSVSVESRQGLGTSFTVRLPRAGADNDNQGETHDKNTG